MEQKFITTENNYAQIDQLLGSMGIRSLFVVCDAAYGFLRIKNYFDTIEERLGISVCYFSDFKPNPLYESVVEGVRVFNENKCEMIAAVGGGSAMDVAKCIKLYSNMDNDKNYLEQEIVPNDIPLLAVPTTAGTGSEATRYAVIYYNGEKQSVSDYSAIPSIVLLDASSLKTLPMYQKKSTMLDALCHAIESFWSVNSTDESKEYSKEAIKLILEYKDAYLSNDDSGNENMLRAANIAGKAINITQTTAGHAMCYKLTSLYGIAHGHAAALCVDKLWRYMLDNTDKCIDGRGSNYLEGVFADIANAMNINEPKQAAELFSKLIKELEFEIPKAEAEDYAILKTSVNPTRLKNNPVGLSEEVINRLYHEILE